MNMGKCDRIRVIHAYDKEDAIKYYPVVIVGAGESGLAAACLLKKNGFDQFRVFERQSGLGGTWWSNRYPGVACDLPALSYSFSFAPNFSSKQLFPSGAEIVEYFYRVASDFGILDKTQFDTEVTEMRWNESEQLWDIAVAYLAPGIGDLSTKQRQERSEDTGNGPAIVLRERIKARVVLSCVGILVEPKPFPESVTGINGFQGEIVHTSRWPDHLVLEGKDVVVIGAGCSAAQVVPAMLQASSRPKSVTQIIRSAPYIDPRLQEPGGKERYARVAPRVFEALPLLGFVLRALLFVFVELLWFTVFQSKNIKLRQQAEQASLEHMRSQAPEKYHAAMTPDYPFGCKRRLLDQDWLKSMNDERFALTTDRLIDLEGKSVIVERLQTENEEDLPQKTTFPADVLVLANGFEATRWLHPLKVYGRDSRSLHDIWTERGGPQAYMGVAMDGFPNFFFVLGPNTACGHSSFILASENSVNYILRIIRPILQGYATSAEVLKSAEVQYTEDVQQRLKKTVFESCTGWYRDGSGWNSTMYPRSQTDYTVRCMFPKHKHWRIQYTSNGRMHSVLRSLTTYIAIALVFAAWLSWITGVEIFDMAGCIRALRL